MNKEIDIQFLDHVALRVTDIRRSSKWYQKVLGLEEYKLPKWGEFPLFLLSGKSGVALFPANPEDPELDDTSGNVKIDHFAFHVTLENFEKAKRHYEDLELEFDIQDYYYFESIYTRDPDGHTVELTTLKVEEAEFYR